MSRPHRTTIHDIAEALGLNASTVSRALNDNPAVSKKTRELIKEKADEMNYRPNHIAAALRRGRSDILGVIVPAIDRTFFASVIRGIEQEADAAGLRVMVCQTYDSAERERTMVETLQRLQVDGILISVAKDNEDNLDFYRRKMAGGLRIQFFDNVPQELDVPSVVINDQQGAYAATMHLIEGGYKKIACMRGPQNFHIYRDRFRGYQDALAEAGLPFREEYVVDINSHFDNGQEGFSKLWALADRPDAVVSSSDYGAAGAMKAAQAEGIRVPEDMAFIGFANEPFTELITPSLSSVDQSTLTMGQRSAARMIDLIKSNKSGVLDTDRIVLAPRLVVRGSSQRGG